MLRRTALTVVLLLVALAAYLAGTLHHHHRETLTAAGAEARRPLHYACPMHPAYTFDKPGTAPCCGMPLEPVYADGGGPAGAGVPSGAVKVSAEHQQLFGVRVEPVEQGSGSETLRLFGRVTSDETRVFRLTAGLEAYISDVSAVTTGSHVRRNQWLATYSSPEARVPISAFITAVNVLEREETNGSPNPTSLAVARTSVALAVDRLLTLGMPRLQIDEIRESRVTTTAIRLTSPIDGFVLARNISAAQRFDAGAELFQIADLRRVWILADVFGPDADDIRPGAVATVTLPGRGRSLQARVSDIPPQFDPATSTLKIRLEAENPGDLLRPDMFVDVELPVSFAATISVPAQALIDSGRRKTVFVERGEGLFEPREVMTGRRHGDRVQIVHGLAPGERIVTSGTFLIDSESRLRAAVRRGGAATDPVCGMQVDEASARAAGRVVEHAGTTYAFCADVCKESFAQAPAQYLPGARPAAPAPLASHPPAKR